MATILKIPFDLGILDKEKRGASEAPDILSKKINSKFIEVPIDEGNFEKTQKNIENSALKTYSNEEQVIGLGGDHSVSYGLIKAFDRSFENKGLIYFDAHPDCQDYFLPSTYEDILRCVIKDTKIYPNILLVGVREITKDESKYINEKNLKISNNILEIKKLLNKIDNLYISIDIDVLDPKIAPGTGEPVKSGLSYAQLSEILDLILNSGKLRGADLVEISPVLDKKEKTIKLATELLKKLLTLNR